jgi:hypothetical protein
MSGRHVEMGGVAGALVRVLVAMACALAVIVGATTSAMAKEPTGDFTAFKQCPRFTSGVNLCLYARTVGGELVLGKRRVRIEAPITLQGGVDLNEDTFAETFVGALNGETLSRTPQRIPGGLLGTALYATLELAGPASEISLSKRNLVAEEGAGLVLPAMVHLENPMLGGECYIGSRARPIMLALMTGATSPQPPNMLVAGQIGSFHYKDDFEWVEIRGSELVENAFSVPEASGCGRRSDSRLIDELIDLELGLPAPDGRNTIIQDDTFWEATTTSVIASER